MKPPRHEIMYHMGDARVMTIIEKRKSKWIAKVLARKLPTFLSAPMADVLMHSSRWSRLLKRGDR